MSAWWGQYESIFALLVLLAYLAATFGPRRFGGRGRSPRRCLTKPQVAPLVVPFAAWFLARIGWRSPASLGRLAILALVALATTAVLWLPFLAAGGPRELPPRIFATYQNGPYSVLSLNAWNLWWLNQELFAGGTLVGDNQSFLGPLTFRLAGFGLTALLLLLLGYGVYRRPTAQVLALGLAAAALVAFAFLTTMHERYAYAAVVFLAPCSSPNPRVLMRSRSPSRAVFTLNLNSAAASAVAGDRRRGARLRRAARASWARSRCSCILGGTFALLAVADADRRGTDPQPEERSANRRWDDAQAISGASISGTVVRL